MNDSALFIGDVHGELGLLQGLLGRVDMSSISLVVMLGDLVNRGPNSRGVVELLIDMSETVQVIVTLGNHDKEFLRVCSGARIDQLLRMGGAPTVKSYLGHEVGKCVADEFRASVPSEHINFLNRGVEVYEGDGVRASHVRNPLGPFSISAHTYVGTRPIVNGREALLDTGAGEQGGTLSGILWPSRRLVSSNG